jgi:hypothetical protein
MLARGTSLAIVLAGAAGCLGEGEDVPPPRLASIQPERGTPGITVDLTGEHFCQNPTEDDMSPCAPSDAQIYFDTTTVVTAIADDDSATAAVPMLPPGQVDVYLTVDGRASNRLEFMIEIAP